MELSTTREAQDVQPLGSFLAFYGTRKFIPTFTRALHLYLSLARPIQSKPPRPVSTRSILLSTHLRLGLPTGPFPFPLELDHPVFNSLHCATIIFFHRMRSSALRPTFQPSNQEDRNSALKLPRDRVAHLCPKALGSLFFVFCDSQGHGGCT
jgi:hypothetical protein